MPWLRAVCDDVKDVSLKNFESRPITNQLYSEYNHRIENGNCTNLEAFPGCEGKPSCNFCDQRSLPVSMQIKDFACKAMARLQPQPAEATALGFRMMKAIESKIHAEFESQSLLTNLIPICVEEDYDTQGSTPLAAQLISVCRSVRNGTIPELQQRLTLMRIARARGLGLEKRLEPDRPWISSALPGYFWRDRPSELTPLTEEEMRLAKGNYKNQKLLSAKYIRALEMLDADTLYYATLDQTPTLAYFSESRPTPERIAETLHTVSKNLSKEKDSFRMTTDLLIFPYVAGFILDETAGKPELKKKYCAILSRTFETQKANQVGFMVAGATFGVGTGLGAGATALALGKSALRATAKGTLVGTMSSATIIGNKMTVDHLQEYSKFNSFCQRTVMQGTENDSLDLSGIPSLCDNARLSEITREGTTDALISGLALTGLALPKVAGKILLRTH